MPNHSTTAEENDEEASCIPQRKVVKKMASLLVKPQVTFVSLVGHAANGLAFSMIKDEDGKAILTQSPTPMPKPTIPTFGSANATLSRLEFDINLFKTEKDVQAYLDESNIKATRIAKTDTHWVVPGVSEKSLDNVEMVKGDKDGVTYWIGRLKAPLASQIRPPSPEDPTKKLPLDSAGVGSVESNTQANPKNFRLAPSSLPTDPISKAEKSKARLRDDDDETPFDHVFKAEAAPEMRQVVSKMDRYMAKQLKLTEMEAVMATGEASLPGFWDITHAIEITVQNIISNSAPGEIGAKIRAAFAVGGGMAAGLASVFIRGEAAEGVEKFEIARDLARKQFSSPAAVSAAGVVKKGEGEVADLAALVKKALSDGLALLETKVDNIAKSQDEVKETVTKSVTELETRIVELEGVRQIRKSMPDDGTPTPVAKSDKDKQKEIRKAEQTKNQEEETAKDLAFEKKQARQRLGIR